MTLRSIPRALALSVLLAAPAARGDVFGPGPLSRAHASLEGLASCTRCHVAGEGLSAARCLECHPELRARLAAGRGLHGRIPEAERACERCHHEHQGRDFALVDWGDGGRNAFDHARTGFPLRGAHRRVACARCHDRRLVEDPAVLDALARAPARETFLGAPQACAACHADEHRGQLGTDCARCHGEDRWKPAARFDHARAAFPLDGAHARARCERCHAREAAPLAAAPARTGPVDPARAARYRGIAFAACTDCHRDPHAGRLGAACASCHGVESWRRIAAAAAERAFHDRTRYPLRGAHARVACDACHPAAPGGARRYRGLAFGSCADCHADAHAGQVEAARRPAPVTASTPTGDGGAGGAASCDRCHGLDAWLPVKFELEDHATTSFPLDGAHRAVACSRCHPRDEALARRVAAARPVRGRGRAPRVSLARLDLPRAGDCRTCHEDPHRGQLDARMGERGCASCHDTASFRKVRLDHAATRFPLAGRHRDAACASCHRPDAAGVVRYRPLPLACGGCHADPHAGQLARSGETDCARCHEPAAWKPPSRFVHAPPFTEFVLDGKHRGVACDRCHPAARVGTGADAREIRRYRGVPATCAGCHADAHRGAFRGFEP